MNKYAPKTIGEVIQRILAAEKEEGLFEWKIDGVPIYSFLRMSLYYAMTEGLNIYHPQPNVTPSNTFNRSISYIKSLFKWNALWGVRNYPLVINPHNRKILDEHQLIDVYTNYFIHDLNIPYATIHPPHTVKTANAPIKANQNSIFLHFIDVQRKLYLKAHPPTLKQREIVTQFNKVFQKFVGAKLDLNPTLLFELRKSLANLHFSRKLFARLQPKVFIDLVNYSHGHFTFAAKECGAVTVEIQHSTFSDFHLGYHFPHVVKGSVGTFADYLLTFGSYWRLSADLPINENKIIDVGFPHFEEQVKKYSHLPKIKNSVVFISQQVLGNNFAQFAMQVAEKMPNYNFYFKLHPKQIQGWQTNLPALLSAPSNVHLVIDSGPSLYELFAISEWVAGVFSTAIYEGAAFNAKGILIDFPGIEYMNRPIRCGIFEKVNSIEAFISHLQASTASGSNKCKELEVFKLNSIANIQNFIKNLFDHTPNTEIQ